LDSDLCRNPNEQAIDDAGPNFLISQPENAPVIGSACNVVSSFVNIARAGCGVRGR